jgi:HD superfamily phosphohydrolase
MIPEVDALANPPALLRVPPEMDVPITPRVRRLIDTPPLRRLARVSQLGLVALVYPGAVHSRLEHSLGVYRAALQVLNHLRDDPRYRGCVTPRDVEAIVVAALVHDSGHWPFCHPIEDMGLEGVPRHESRVRQLVAQSELGACLREDWHCDPEQILRILEKRPRTDAEQLAASILSGPIDIDKIDYLTRDSLHAGVPYGRNFDVGRLIGSLRIHPAEYRLAIGEKGRTAAEMMVFARYVMFSEVYWHHAVRSATAMLQRAVYLLDQHLELASWIDSDDAGWVDRLRERAVGTAAAGLVEGLFGPRRRLLKRAAQFNVLDRPKLHSQLAHRPYAYLAAVSERLAELLATQLGIPLGAAEVIIDAPPIKLEVDINMDVVTRGGGTRPLGEVSPVVEALARRQFDSHVKRVRVFVPEAVRERLPGGEVGERMICEAIGAA